MKLFPLEIRLLRGLRLNSFGNALHFSLRFNREDHFGDETCFRASKELNCGSIAYAPGATARRGGGENTAEPTIRC